MQGKIISGIADFIPVIGEIKGIAEAITGKDLITDEELNTGERILGALPVVAGGLKVPAKAIRHAKITGGVANFAYKKLKDEHVLKIKNGHSHTIYIVVMYQSNKEWIVRGWNVCKPGETIIPQIPNRENCIQYYMAECCTCGYIWSKKDAVGHVPKDGKAFIHLDSCNIGELRYFSEANLKGLDTLTITLG